MNNSNAPTEEMTAPPMKEKVGASASPSKKKKMRPPKRKAEMVIGRPSKSEKMDQEHEMGKVNNDKEVFGNAKARLNFVVRQNAKQTDIEKTKQDINESIDFLSAFRKPCKLTVVFK